MNLQDFLAKFDHGTPDIDEIGRGMHACYVNAWSLLEDAEFLLDRSPGRSISLAILAWEETAKIFLLAEAASKVSLGIANWKKIRSELRLQSHQFKQTVFGAYGKSILKKVRNINHQNPYENDIPGGIIPLVDKLKQIGLYVDLFEGKFLSPQQFGSDNREIATWLIAACKERLESIKPMHNTEEDSINIARRIANLVEQLSQVKSYEEIKNLIKVI